MFFVYHSNYCQQPNNKHKSSIIKLFLGKYSELVLHNFNTRIHYQFIVNLGTKKAAIKPPLTLLNVSLFCEHYW